MHSPLALIPKADEEGPPAPDVTGMLETARTLCSRLPGETHRAVRHAVILTLIVNPTQTAIQALLRQPDHAEATLRNQLLALLRLMPEAIEPLMENLLADEDRTVRQFALNLFREVPQNGEHTADCCDNRGL